MKRLVLFLFSLLYIFLFSACSQPYEQAAGSVFIIGADQPAEPTETEISEKPETAKTGYSEPNKTEYIPRGIGPYADLTPYKPIEPFGKVPEKFKSVVENNSLRDIILSGDYYFVYNRTDSTFTIEKYNFDFKKTLFSTFELNVGDRHYEIGNIIATSDGGLLFSLQNNTYARGDGTWSSGDSKLVKCDSKGNFAWKYELEGFTDNALDYIYEAGDYYYLFADMQTPETKVIGVSSATDIRVLKFNKNGILSDERTYGGSGSDMLFNCEAFNDRFELLIDTQSDDGDFHASEDGIGVFLTVIIDMDMNIISFNEDDYGLMFKKSIGVMDGKKVYNYQETLAGFKDGYPYAVIDYGEYYLVVSVHTIGEYIVPLFANHIPRYYENIYGAYSKDGTLLWRATGGPPLTPEILENVILYYKDQS